MLSGLSLDEGALLYEDDNRVQFDGARVGGHATGVEGLFEAGLHELPQSFDVEFRLEYRAILKVII